MNPPIPICAALALKAGRPVRLSLTREEDVHDHTRYAAHISLRLAARKDGTLTGAEIELVPAFSREQRLKRAIDAVIDDYDYVLIDCPPSLGLLTVNSLVASTHAILSTQAQHFSLQGVEQAVEMGPEGLFPQVAPRPEWDSHDLRARADGFDGLRV